MSLRESETLELKRSTSELKEAVISIGAILNKHGRGRVYFGIEDGGSVVGQHIGRKTTKDISQAISAHIDPRIYPDIEVREIDGKSCVAVDFSGHDGLYSAFGRFYLRSGDEDRKLSAREIARLIEKKKNYAYSWGNVLQLAARSEAYIKEHINWRADLTGSQRVEIPEVPVRAVREAIITPCVTGTLITPKATRLRFTGTE